MAQSIVTLTTDFGTADSYVAQMKGVILATNAAARIVDVTHSVPPQDVAQAARVLAEIVPAFPAGTIHVAVVDPGVGSRRRLLAAEAAGQRFLAPDNGLLASVFARWSPERICELVERRFWRDPVSATFHGRDILAPVAGHWSLGIDVAEFGPAVCRESLVSLPVSKPIRDNDGLIGRVEFADSFGNLVTNIAATDLPGTVAWITLGGHKINGLSRCYADVASGTVLALIGSSGRLEMAINGGSAANELNVVPGAEVRVTFGEPGT
ncbi:MAG: SAM-dependent chlorinase/fluorinase [Planctomycetia bacterium]|nr:SAM-dependent chlorinase/fluorinase [Planctomycetia bacterium]